MTTDAETAPDLRALQPLCGEQTGWRLFERFLRRQLRAVGLDAVHAYITSYLDPVLFCHAFVPRVASSYEPVAEAEAGGDERAKCWAHSRSFFGGECRCDECEYDWPRCPGCEEGVKCSEPMTHLVNLLVKHLPAAVYAAIAPPSSTGRDALQCFACLQCHFRHGLRVLSPFPGFCRWREWRSGMKGSGPASQAQRGVVDSEAGAVDVVSDDVSLADIDERLDASTGQLQWPSNHSQLVSIPSALWRLPSPPRLVLPVQRLRSWLRVAHTPSLNALDALISDDADLRSRVWQGWHRPRPVSSGRGRQAARPPRRRYAALLGYAAHHNTLDQPPLCPHQPEEGSGSSSSSSPSPCGAAMQLLWTLPCNQLLPVECRRLNDLWIWQCPQHKGVFNMSVNN